MASFARGPAIIVPPPILNRRRIDEEDEDDLEDFADCTDDDAAFDDSVDCVNNTFGMKLETAVFVDVYVTKESVLFFRSSSVGAVGTEGPPPTVRIVPGKAT